MAKKRESVCANAWKEASQSDYNMDTWPRPRAPWSAHGKLLSASHRTMEIAHKMSQQAGIYLHRGPPSNLASSFGIAEPTFPGSAHVGTFWQSLGPCFCGVATGHNADLGLHRRNAIRRLQIRPASKSTENEGRESTVCGQIMAQVQLVQPKGFVVVVQRHRELGGGGGACRSSDLLRRHAQSIAGREKNKHNVL